MNDVIRRPALVAALTASALSLPISSGLALAGGGHASGSCSPSFTLVDLPAYLQFPDVAAGIASGSSTVADDTAFFNLIDKNGSGLICVKPAGSQAVAHLYYVNAVDDHSAASASATPDRTFLPFTETVSSCGAFNVKVADVVDEEYQTVQVSADGTLVIHVTGDLVLKFTNMTSGKSVTAHSPGPYTVTVHADGSGDFISLGLGINSFDPALATAYGLPPIAQVAGQLQVTFVGSTVTNIVTRGHVVDICAELS